MKPYVWTEGMTEKQMRDGAYWERNMLAVLMAKESNDHCKSLDLPPDSGYYVHGAWKGWSRVISIYNGGITFHVPDDFDIGEDIPLIAPNWNGHTTEEKWEFVADLLEMELEEG